MHCETCGNTPAYPVKHIPTNPGWIELTEWQTLCASCVAKLRDETEQALMEDRRREGEVNARG